MDITLPADLWPRRGGWGGKVVSLLKRPGDKVEAGEPIAEVEIEKAILVIESPKSGILDRYFVSPGDAVGPGSTLARLKEHGEDKA